MKKHNGFHFSKGTKGVLEVVGYSFIVAAIIWAIATLVETFRKPEMITIVHGDDVDKESEEEEEETEAGDSDDPLRGWDTL